MADVYTDTLGNRWWRRRHSAWLILPLLFGLATGIAFFYVGIRAKKPKWWIAGIVYGILAVVERRGNSLSALWAGVRAEFERNDFDIWTAELSGDVDQERAVGIVQAVDQAYGRQVQAAVLQRIAERAGSAGMTVDSTSKNADESITVVLSVDRVMA